MAYQTVFNATSQKHACSAILKRFSQESMPCTRSVCAAQLAETGCQVSSLDQLFVSKPYFGQMPTDPKIPSMQSEKCGVSREAAPA
jgi:hypothetical protein